MVIARAYAHLCIYQYQMPQISQTHAAVKCRYRFGHRGYKEDITAYIGKCPPYLLYTGAAATGSGMLGDMIASVTGATPMGAMAEDQAKLMIRAMIEAAKADGAIDADEQAQITAHLKDASPEELAYVQSLMAAPLDFDGLVAATTAATRTQVYSASLMAIKPDSAVEQAYLAQLASALGLDPATRDAIHASVGMAPLTA